MENRPQHFAMKLFSILLLAALIAVGVWEKRSIASLRAENATLSEQQSTAQALADENAALAKRLGEASAPAPEVNKPELLRLRNDVRRLRSSQTDPAKISAENERLAGELSSGKIRPQRLADQPGFVASESWVKAGTATPEAALQTMLVGIRDTDGDAMLQVLPPAQADELRREMAKNPESLRYIGTQIKPTGFVIAGREELNDQTVRLKVKFAAQSEPMVLDFHRVGDSWKMSKGF